MAEVQQKKVYQLQKLGAVQLQFSVDIYKKCVAHHNDDIFISPTSILVALAMTYLGARGNTKRQLKDTLKLDVDDDELSSEFQTLLESLNVQDGTEKYTIHLANSLYLQKDFPLLPSFVSAVEKVFGATPKSVDFKNNRKAEAAEINGWISDRTGNKITDMINPSALDEDTLLLLVNAAYFKGEWQSRFDKLRTTTEEFHLLDGGDAMTEFMYQKGKFKTGRNALLKSRIIELPYAGDRFSFCVLLPDETRGLPYLEDKMNADSLAESLNAMAPASSVLLWLPRFSLRKDLSLREHLADMGLRDMFAEHEADFTGLTDSSDLDLHVSDVLHKAVVEVDEDGTEAAAATAVAVNRMKRSAMPEETQVFKVNHPFVFLIRDKSTGVILFLGRLVNPTPSSTTAKQEL